MRTGVFREYVCKNEKFCKTVFSLSYEAQVDFFFKVLKILWHCPFKYLNICKVDSRPRYFYPDLAYMQYVLLILMSNTFSAYIILSSTRYPNRQCTLYVHTEAISHQNPSYTSRYVVIHSRLFSNKNKGAQCWLSWYERSSVTRFVLTIFFVKLAPEPLIDEYGFDCAGHHVKLYDLTPWCHKTHKHFTFKDRRAIDLRVSSNRDRFFEKVRMGISSPSSVTNKDDIWKRFLFMSINMKLYNTWGHGKGMT